MFHGLEQTDVRLRIPANTKKHYEAPQIVNILSHGKNPLISPVSFPSFISLMSFCHVHGLSSLLRPYRGSGIDELIMFSTALRGEYG